jgi:hypothetical protein
LDQIPALAEKAKELRAFALARSLASNQTNFINCSEALPAGKNASYSTDGKVVIRGSWLQKTFVPDEISRVIFHELLHSAGIKDEAAVEKLVSCCSKGYDSSSLACKGPDSIASSKPDEDAIAKPSSADALKKIDSLNSEIRQDIDEKFKTEIKKAKDSLTCLKDQAPTPKCQSEAKMFFEQTKRQIKPEVCFIQSEGEECKAALAYGEQLLKVKAAECFGGNRENCDLIKSTSESQRSVSEPQSTQHNPTNEFTPSKKETDDTGTRTKAETLAAIGPLTSREKADKMPKGEKFKHTRVDPSDLTSMQRRVEEAPKAVEHALTQGRAALRDAAKQITVIDKAQAETRTPTAKAAPETQRTTKPERSAKAEAPPEERPKSQAKGRSSQTAAPVYVAAAPTQQNPETRTPAAKQEEQTTTRSTTTPRGSSESTTGSTGSGISAGASPSGGSSMRATASSMTSQGPKLRAGKVEISPISVSAVAFGGSLGGETSGSRGGAAPAAQINPANFVRGTTPTMTASASMRVAAATDGGGGATAPISSGGGGGGGGSSGFLSGGGGSSGSAAASSRAGSDERSRPAEQQADTQVIMNRFAKRAVSNAGELKALIRDVAKETDPATLLEQAWFESHCQSLNLHIVGEGKSCGKPNLPRRSIKSFLLGN